MDTDLQEQHHGQDLLWRQERLYNTIDTVCFGWLQQGLGWLYQNWL
jgi:hypothetical protein